MASQKTRTLTLILTITMLLISACGGAEPSATPTEISLEAIYTAAAATVFAGQTGTAAAQPSPTPTFTSSPTLAITETPTATRAAVVPIQPVIVVVKTLTGTPGTALPSITPTYGAVGGKNSILVQGTTDPKAPAAGQSFTQDWLIKNTGTGTWNGNYKFYFMGGSLMGSDTTRILKTVGPNGTYTQRLKFIAPNAPGTYTGYWRLMDDTGVFFGAGFSVTITVPGPTHTPVPAMTATPTSNVAGTQAAVAATQTAISATQAAISASQTAAAGPAATQAAIDAANAAATQAAIDAANAAATQAAIDAANATATQAAIDATATAAAGGG